MRRILKPRVWKQVAACTALAGVLVLQSAAVDWAAVTDYTNYNAGSEVRIRFGRSARDVDGVATIRYAGEEKPVASRIAVRGSEYRDLWRIPNDARTGRYEIDVRTTSGETVRSAASFAVHRQLVKVMAVDLDKTFYTSGDAVTPRVRVKNVSQVPLNSLQVEFEPYTYPWIAPEPDEPPMWKTVIAKSLALAPGEEREFVAEKAAVLQVEKEPEAVYYSVVIRSSLDAARIYDLAFAPPAFTVPANNPFPKQYPFLYLYWRLRDLPKSEAYREFYPAQFVSEAIAFDRTHTMFRAGEPATIRFTMKASREMKASGSVLLRILDSKEHELEQQRLSGNSDGDHQARTRALMAGRYIAEASIEAHGVTVARNRMELAVNPMPKSILVFCAHEDDDTAHPGVIRAAVENHVPIHFVYFTSGDAGGCDRFYMHSCDAARAMDFGEVRMEETRASLGHLGVPRENIWFLGMPDGGMEQIWFKHKSAEKPYLSVLLASDHSPYRESAIPNLPYALEPAVEAAKGFIERLQPDLIITGHPDERHVDHRVNNWIVVKAMQELLREGRLARETKLEVDVAYGARAGKRAPYRYERQKFFVSGEAAKLGQEATWYYQSQDGNHEQANLADYEKLPREEPYPHFEILDWQEHAGWNEQ